MNPIPHTYFQWLYDAVGKLDQKSMSEGFADAFNTEVDGGGYTRGAASQLAIGPYATKDIRCAFSCLMRGGYNVVKMDVRLITRRLDSKWIPRWTDDDDKCVSNAEVIVLDGLFNGELAEAMTPSERADFVWFIKDAIENGVVILAATEDTDADLNLFSDELGEILENIFEVANGPQTDTAQNKRTRSNVKHSGNETPSKRSGKHKRTDTKRHKP
jgi:hypothetical protein